MRKNDASIGNIWTGQRGELAHQISIRQTVEAESPHSCIQITARDREQLSNPWHVTMEGSVEAGNLGNVGKCLAKTFDQRDFSREVRKVERLRSTQLCDELDGDTLIVKQMNAAMHNAVADCTNGGCAKALPQISQDALNTIMKRRGSNRARFEFSGFIACSGEARARHSNALDLPSK